MEKFSHKILVSSSDTVEPTALKTLYLLSAAVSVTLK